MTILTFFFLLLKDFVEKDLTNFHTIFTIAKTVDLNWGLCFQRKFMFCKMLLVSATFAEDNFLVLFAIFTLV